MFYFSFMTIVISEIHHSFKVASFQDLSKTVYLIKLTRQTILAQQIWRSANRICNS